MRRAKPRKATRGTDRRVQPALRDAGMRARIGLAAVLGTKRFTRSCLHLAAVTQRVLIARPNWAGGVPIIAQTSPVTIEVGAIRLITGRDREGPVGSLYDPDETAGEWHAWLRAGEWLVDASAEDLQRMIVETGQADRESYRPRELFAFPVLVAKARDLNADGHASYQSRTRTRAVLAGFAQSAGDQELVERATAVAMGGTCLG